MSKTWHFYHAETGEPSGRSYSGPEQFLAENTPADHQASEDAPPPATLIEVDRSIDEPTRRRLIAQGQIDALEGKTARPLRELVIDPQNEKARQRLDQIEAQIVSLRKDLD